MLRALIAALFLMIAPAAAQTPQHARYNGLYVAEPEKQNDTPYHYYFRLYPDGHVSAVSSTGEAKSVAAWLSRDSEESDYVRQGEYTISGNGFSAWEKGPYGMVEYNGKIDGERLELDTVSRINGHKGHLQFNFVAVDALR